jgi:hypothetical protein
LAKEAGLMEKFREGFAGGITGRGGTFAQRLAGGIFGLGRGLVEKFKGGRKAITDAVEEEIRLEGERALARDKRAREEKEEKGKTEKELAREKALLELRKLQEKTAIILAREAARRRREKAKRLKEINKLREKESKLIAKIQAREAKAKAVGALRERVQFIKNRIAAHENEIAKLREVAEARVVDIIADTKARKQQIKEREAEQKKIALLEAKELRGVKLGREQREFLAAARARKRAIVELDFQKWMQAQRQRGLLAAQDKLADLQKTSNDELKKIREKLDKLLQMK